LAYVPKSTRRPSLLTQRRPHSYSKAVSPRNRARNRSGTQNGVSKTTREIDDKNRLEKQFISSQAFHRTPGGRVRETTTGERFRPRILEPFDSATQESHRLPPCNDSHTLQLRIERKSNKPINTVELRTSWSKHLAKQRDFLWRQKDSTLKSAGQDWHSDSKKNPQRRSKNGRSNWHARHSHLN
jgi:hypothetical protein